MKSRMNIHYDEEGDYLEFNVGKPTKGYFRDIGEGIFERIDEKTGKTIGIGILSFKKRTRSIKDIKVELPVKLTLAKY